MLAAALGLAACGGGGSDAVAVDIGVVVGSQALSGVQIASGGSQTIYIIAGQSIEPDANAPLVWTPEVAATKSSGHSDGSKASAASSPASRNST
jgi:hypothetical protein